MWVCSCNSIREHDIKNVIKEKNITKPNDVCRAFQCMPKCG